MFVKKLLLISLFSSNSSVNFLFLKQKLVAVSFLLCSFVGAVKRLFELYMWGLQIQPQSRQYSTTALYFSVPPTKEIHVTHLHHKLSLPCPVLPVVFFLWVVVVMLPSY